MTRRKFWKRNEDTLERDLTIPREQWRKLYAQVHPAVWNLLTMVCRARDAPKVRYIEHMIRTAVRATFGVGACDPLPVPEEIVIFRRSAVPPELQYLLPPPVVDEKKSKE